MTFEPPNLNIGGIKYLCIDLETYDPLLKDSGPSWIRGMGHIVAIGLGWRDEHGQQVRCFTIGSDCSNNLNAPSVLNYIQSLEAFHVPILFQKGQYDLGWLRSRGVNLLDCSIYDCMVGAQVIDNQLLRYNLNRIASLWLNRNKFGLEEIYGEGVKNRMHTVPQADLEKYTLEDVKLEMELHEYELTQFAKYDLWRAYDLECKIIPITVRMKEQGVAIDLEYVAQLKKQFTAQQKEIMTWFRNEYKIYDLNVWSIADVEKVCKRGNIQLPRTSPTSRHPIGQPSATGDFLSGVDHPIAANILKIRRLDRLTNGFLKGLQELQIDGRIHSDYYSGRSDDGGTITGRFSCANPNMQQIPIRTGEGSLLRACFIADEGRSWNCNDYSQQEPRLSVHYASKMGLSGIAYWTDQFRENPNADFYTLMTEIASISRGDSKTMTLAKSYGMGPNKMSRRLHNTQEESYAMLKEFDRNIPWMRQAMDKCIEIGQKRSYIKSFMGRRLVLPKGRPYAIFNHLLQGSAAEQTKMAMVDLWNQKEIVPSSAVHDELNCQVNSKEEGLEIAEIMKQAITLDIPVKVESGIGQNWKQAKENAH